MVTDRDTLPRTFNPVHYDLSIFNIEFGGKWEFHGNVNIQGSIQEEGKQITLNARELNLKNVSLSVDSSKPEKLNSTDITYDEAKQRATLHFAEPFQASQTASITIEFQGTCNPHLAGFYRSKYKAATTAPKSVGFDGEHHYMLSTQFEACDARRAFPCFDEPNLKASFTVSLEVPEDQVALSNMPEVETRKSAKDGHKIVHFEKTPVMSTYLLAWAVGDFAYVEGFTDRKYNGKQLPVRVYTTRGLEEQGRFALWHACKIIDLFSEVFKIDYPLPKSDLLCVSEFAMGAMENWGLVTYRTTAVLFDEETSDPKYKNRVAYVVAHELAHQWFGNLVTMDWWNELWLNEGFATWVGWYACDKLHPDWQLWSQWVTEGYQSALNLDALRSSHPIEVPVKDALEVDQIFDAISYLKGSSVIRMLSSYLGVDTFLLGVSNYLKAHQYGNARTTDLWAALSEASGQDVAAFMDNWIKKIGFPVITVAEEPGQIGVQQRRFLSSGDVKPEEDQTLWWVPLNLKTKTPAEAQAPETLGARESTIRNTDTEFYKLNVDSTGFYRTNYPPARLAQLGAARSTLSVEDKIGLIGDATALAKSGDGTTAALLALLEEFSDETDYLVWSQIVTSLGTVRQVFADDEDLSRMLRKFTLKLTSPAAERLGWEFAASEHYLTGQLRALLIGCAGLAGHEGIVAEATRRFNLYSTGKDSSVIHPSLRSTIYRISVNNGGKSEYEFLKQESVTSTAVDGAEICHQAMGRVQSTDLAEDFFDHLMSDKVSLQNVASGTTSLGSNSKTRATLWQCVQTKWPAVVAKMSSNPGMLDRMLRNGLNRFTSLEIERDIKSFFSDKDTRAYSRTLDFIADSITSNARYRERDAPLVAEWLKAHRYD